MDKAKIGIFGGSGFYSLFTEKKDFEASTPTTMLGRSADASEARAATWKRYNSARSAVREALGKVQLEHLR